MKRIVCVLATALLLQGCAACQSFRAAWYFESDASSRFNLALLHEGASDVTLRRIVVNPGAAGKPLGTFDFAAGRSLSPGSLLVLPVNARPPMQECGVSALAFVPVLVEMQCDAGSTRVPVSGTLPNYLPDSWLPTCK